MRLEDDRQQLAGKGLKDGGLGLLKVLFRHSPVCDRSYSNFTSVTCNCATNNRRKHGHKAAHTFLCAMNTFLGSCEYKR
jgi:hypothetical protein